MGKRSLENFLPNKSNAWKWKVELDCRTKQTNWLDKKYPRLASRISLLKKQTNYFLDFFLAVFLATFFFAFAFAIFILLYLTLKEIAENVNKNLCRKLGLIFKF